jgi:chromosome partitioning protein
VKHPISFSGFVNPGEPGGDLSETPLARELTVNNQRLQAINAATVLRPTRTRIFTISNQKGGVGKTTTAVNLAAALALKGLKVLVIDLDPQGNASTALGVDHRVGTKSIYEVLVEGLPLKDAISKSSTIDGLYCVPATIDLAGAEMHLFSSFDDMTRNLRLRQAIDAYLTEAPDRPDYVFIDCPPSLGLLTINAFAAAREVLIPIQCEYCALEGLSQLLKNIDLIQKALNPQLRLSTILLTMFDSRTRLASQVADDVREHFPQQTLDAVIPRSVRVSEAPSYQQSVITYDRSSPGSISYLEAAIEMANKGANNG